MLEAHSAVEEQSWAIVLELQKLGLN